ncbi:MAG: PTS sugar transporter subunit IIB [Candidatus Izemoplasmatales bacterium]|jgi:PTS system ascorbate-specific IIB component|nr:PTS sugar transporter subunit IIB [Candidatus Izemoplasmatales bacterium]
MKKIVAICGMGFGSSFIVELNIKNALKELGVKDIDVDHMDLGSAYPGVADLIICGKDLEDNCKRFGEVMPLNSLFDKKELKDKITQVLTEKGVI